MTQREPGYRDDDRPWLDTVDEDYREDRADVEPPDRVCYPSAPSADGVAGHQVRRPR